MDTVHLKMTYHMSGDFYYRLENSGSAEKRIHLSIECFNCDDPTKASKKQAEFYNKEHYKEKIDRIG